MTERKYSLMNESWSMILTYVSAMILVFVLTFHLLLQSPLAGKTFEDTLAFNYATGNLVYFKVLFGLLLYAAILHGLNGARVIVLEWLHPRDKAWILNLIIVAMMAFFLALGTYTLVMVV